MYVFKFVSNWKLFSVQLIYFDKYAHQNCSYFFRLACEVTYTPTNLSGQPLSFRKFFKFQVIKPLDVKTKFYNVENDGLYLEAQIQNLTASPICLDIVSLESSHLFTGKTIFSLNMYELWKIIHNNCFLSFDAQFKW